MGPTHGLDLCGRGHEPIPAPGPGAPFDIVLLDRDGTLNAHAPGYRTPDDVVLLPGAADAVAALTRAGCRVAVVTNQRGIATGHLTWQELAGVHAILLDAVRAAGGRIDDLRVCPHAAGECVCRKPLPGLIDALFSDNPHLRRAHSVMVGDTDSDAAAAAAAGVPFVRVDPATGLPGAVDSLLSVRAGTIPSRS